MIKIKTKQHFDLQKVFLLQPVFNIYYCHYPVAGLQKHRNNKRNYALLILCLSVSCVTLCHVFRMGWWVFEGLNIEFSNSYQKQLQKRMLRKRIYNLGMCRGDVLCTHALSSGYPNLFVLLGCLPIFLYCIFGFL